MAKSIKRGNKKDFSKKSKITKSKEVVNLNNNDYVEFSFKYLTNTKKFDYKKMNDNGYLPTFLEKLRDISKMKYMEFLVPKGNSNALRCHAIKWNEVTEDSFGIPNEEQLVEQPRQFQISSNNYGRVHGFFIGKTFFIVWLDKNHKLYS